MVKRLDKKGSQFVEASMVLPLVFLLVLSLIGLTQFHLATFKTQIKVQEEILMQVDRETSSYKNIVIEDRTLLSIDGAYRGLFEKDYRGHWLKLNEGWAIRAGGLGNVLTE